MTAQNTLRLELASFLRFTLVGAAGFLADGGVLAILIHAGVRPLLARLISAPLAVLLTFSLNRAWSFAQTANRPIGPALLAYCGVQGAGFLTNLAIFALAIWFLPSPLNEPLLAFVLGSATALAVNYAGARLIVFRQPRTLSFRDPS